MRKHTFALAVVAVATFLFLGACGSSEFRGGTVPGMTHGKDADSEKDSADAEPEASGDAISSNDAVNESSLQESGTDNELLSLNESVVFGDVKVFRIGNDVAAGTSCLKDLESFATAGKKYEFSFEVVSDDTTVQIGLNTLCGIDVSKFNLIYVLSGDSVVQKASLSEGQTSAVLAPMKLAKGSYSLFVESTKITELFHRYRGEWDDFIVGNINISADNKLIPGDATPH